ncbi:MAG: hypothetical protein SVU88_03560 [Candidatus Nanohaloarchaea archaeon]|nr:hypothetical protein [Candidatus Nanohaloarchaea archaeon]
MAETEPSDAGQQQGGEAAEQGGQSRPGQEQPRDIEAYREEIEEDLLEDVDERIGRRLEEQEPDTAGYWVKDEVVHTIGSYAGRYMGWKRPDSEEPFGLYTLWLVLPNVLQDILAKEYREKVSVFSWDTWMNNRHLIPVKYLWARKGIDEAIKAGDVRPPSMEVWQYKMLTRVPPIGPPIGYVKYRSKHMSPSREQVQQWVDYIHPLKTYVPPESFSTSKEEALRSQAERLMKDIKRYQAEVQRARKNGNRAREQDAARDEQDARAKLKEIRQELKQLEEGG